MDIRRIESNESMCLADLDPGDVFQLVGEPDDLYLVIKRAESTDPFPSISLRSCVNLETGGERLIGFESRVILIDGVFEERE